MIFVSLILGEIVFALIFSYALTTSIFLNILIGKGYQKARLPDYILMILFFTVLGYVALEAFLQLFIFVSFYVMLEVFQSIPDWMPHRPGLMLAGLVIAALLAPLGLMNVHRRVRPMPTNGQTYSLSNISRIGIVLIVGAFIFVAGKWEFRNAVFAWEIIAQKEAVLQEEARLKAEQSAFLPAPCIGEECKLPARLE